MRPGLDGGQPTDPSSRVPIAFYAPLKSPNHPSPSGDRTMARLLLKALHRAGFEPHLASELRTLDRHGDFARQAELAAEGRREAERLIETYRTLPSATRPRLWFTYHVYYKAPDPIGPRVAEALAIPYAVAEGSRAGKRAGGAWAAGHLLAEAALDRADAVFVMTARDREALERKRPPQQRLIDLPPFIDPSEWSLAGSEAPRPVEDGPARLLAVAMMRPGDKLASFRQLAEALATIAGLPWTLDLVGDGEAAAEVAALFAPLGDRVRRHGAVSDPNRLGQLYAGADLLVWPAVNEAYGMVLLEAQAHGCPVVAGRHGGVPSVVRNNETGLLVPPDAPDAFAEAVACLLGSQDRRRQMGAAAARFVAGERGIEGAAARLGAGLRSLIGLETPA